VLKEELEQEIVTGT